MRLWASTEGSVGDTRSSDTVRRVLAHPVGPTALAVLLAVASLPIVAPSLNAVTPTSASSVPEEPFLPNRRSLAFEAEARPRARRLAVGTKGDWPSTFGIDRPGNDRTMIQAESPSILSHTDPRSGREVARDQGGKVHTGRARGSSSLPRTIRKERGLGR